MSDPNIQVVGTLSGILRQMADKVDEAGKQKGQEDANPTIVQCIVLFRAVDSNLDVSIIASGFPEQMQRLSLAQSGANLANNMLTAMCVDFKLFSPSEAPETPSPVVS